MNLADMLAYADIHQLSRIAQHYNCVCSTNSKNELIQSILSVLNRSDIFEHTLQSLSVEDLRFLNAIVFDKRDAYSLEELMAWANKTRFDDSFTSGPSLPMIVKPLSEAEELKPRSKKRTRSNKSASNNEHAMTKVWSPRETIMQFKQRGWLFNGHSHHTKYLFTVPKDLKRRIGDGLAQQFLMNLETCGTPEVYRAEHDLFLEDIGRFLQFVRREEVILTADGFIYKRQLQQVLQSLHVEEQVVQREAWRFGYGRKFKEYPNRFSLLYDYCFFHNYIIEEGDRLKLTAQGDEVLADGRMESPVDVYRFWIRLYKGAVNNIQPLVHWIRRLTERWTTVESLGRTLCPFIKPYYYDQPQPILEQRILNMMMHLGLVRTGHHKTAGAVVQITTLGQQVIDGTYVEEQDRIELPED